MAVPARRTSKAKKNKRRTHYKVTAPSVNFDETTGDYSRSHRVSLKGRNTPDRLQLKKYSPKLRKHVVFTEVK